MLTTRQHRNTAGRSVWTILANGIPVWTQVAMFAPAEVAELAARARTETRLPKTWPVDGGHEGFAFGRDGRPVRVFIPD